MDLQCAVDVALGKKLGLPLGVSLVLIGRAIKWQGTGEARQGHQSRRKQVEESDSDVKDQSCVGKLLVMFPNGQAFAR